MRRMQALYIISSFISFIGIISLWYLFKFNQLTAAQKVSLILTTIGIAVPIIVGFINGFLNH
jgi:multisubunit Na+/H+ antiporter MnhG subunit